MDETNKIRIQQNQQKLNLGQRLDFVGENATKILSSIDSLVSSSVDSIDYSNKNSKLKLEKRPNVQQPQQIKKPKNEVNWNHSKCPSYPKHKILPTRIISYGNFKGCTDTRRFQCFNSKCNVNFNEFTNCKYCKYMPYFPSPLKNSFSCDTENKENNYEKLIPNHNFLDGKSWGSDYDEYYNKARKGPKLNKQFASIKNSNSHPVTQTSTEQLNNLITNNQNQNNEDSIKFSPTYKYSRSRKFRYTNPEPEVKCLESKTQENGSSSAKVEQISESNDDVENISTRKTSFHNSKFYENLTDHFKKNTWISSASTEEAQTKLKSNEYNTLKAYNNGKQNGKRRGKKLSFLSKIQT
ncbi:uncharacterized protein KGF55_005014 [Candida pseudojiufengensis]|uniref:uncharacterized protein n=1 Tax=Candida pseudojiufengensis TaxID=497109 RepID=UPI0022241DDB|nr:uncharacterized protein KGF55_005014 [Candida pseudojiufengensis]KAI5959782.1 hypothetical protein KGF55_005014 [Candida pseudojiufengensis]